MPPVKKSVKRALGAGVLAGVGYAAWRAWQARVPAGNGQVEWTTAPFPFPPAPGPASARVESTAAPAPAQPAGADWVEPNGDGSCPPTHVIKAKLTSGIYHVPGGANYDRTHPDRCYVSEEAAVRDGLRRAKA
jgi:hypothetical protein